MHPVGKKQTNPWGLYDMAGNVWEWCWDRYADGYDPKDIGNPRWPVEGQWRVLRGGSFLVGPSALGSADRARDLPEARADAIGFRCVRGSVRQLGLVTKLQLRFAPRRRTPLDTEWQGILGVLGAGR